MNELEDKLNALLSNPQLMQQVAGLAQAMGESNKEQALAHQEEKSSPIPSLDSGQIQQIMHAFNQSGVDQDQHALLMALSPYLSTGRINKLERAMRAAKIAGFASRLFKSNAQQSFSGR